MKYYVRAAWDPEASVFYVEDTNVPGLATEAENPTALSEKLTELIPELLEANGCVRPSEPVEITYHQVSNIRLSPAA